MHIFNRWPCGEAVNVFSRNLRCWLSILVHNIIFKHSKPERRYQHLLQIGRPHAGSRGLANLRHGHMRTETYDKDVFQRPIRCIRMVFSCVLTPLANIETGSTFLDLDRSLNHDEYPLWDRTRKRHVAPKRRRS